MLSAKELVVGSWYKFYYSGRILVGRYEGLREVDDTDQEEHSSEPVAIMTPVVTCDGEQVYHISSEFFVDIYNIIAEYN